MLPYGPFLKNTHACPSLFSLIFSISFFLFSLHAHNQERETQRLSEGEVQNLREIPSPREGERLWCSERSRRRRRRRRRWWSFDRYFGHGEVKSLALLYIFVIPMRFEAWEHENLWEFNWVGKLWFLYGILGILLSCWNL